VKLNLNAVVMDLARLQPMFPRTWDFARQKLPACESPLEELFLLLWTYHFNDCHCITYDGIECPWTGTPRGKICIVDLAQQVKVGGSRVDFLATITSANNGKVSRLAIECDGHAFHDRTPQQASRDRARDRKLLQHGVMTARFTYSDLRERPIESMVDLQRTMLAIGAAA